MSCEYQSSTAKMHTTKRGLLVRLFRTWLAIRVWGMGKEGREEEDSSVQLVSLLTHSDREENFDVLKG